MPPKLAALICIIFILCLFWVDRKRSGDVSGALWIPLIWMFFAGSRSVLLWLNLSAPVDKVDAYLEGSPADRAVYLLLMVAGAIVLSRRQVPWGQLLVRNSWVWLYFLFGGLSILWSDYPFVSFKRLIKAFSTVIMALVVLTEKRPYEAAGVVLRRLAFLLVPLSILFIKYYPDLGRTYNRETYETIYTGVATWKNGLGQICLVAGIYFCWALLLRRGERLKLGRTLSIPLNLVFLGMIAWLLHKADSATSLACLVLVVGMLMVSRLSFVAREPRRIMVLGMAAVCLFGVLAVTVDLTDFVVSLLGRGPTFTGRVLNWERLLEMAGNPVVGVGYESFWLGDRLQAFWDQTGRFYHQAHNGYVELYLNVGLIGLGLIVGGMLSGLLKVRRHLSKDYPAAILRLCFIVTVAFYNYTEASFHGVNMMWLLFCLGIMDISGQENWRKREAEAGSENSDDRDPKRHASVSRVSGGGLERTAKGPETAAARRFASTGADGAEPGMGAGLRQ